jgi:hypothetical protein
MEQLKVRNKEIIVWNVVLYLALSYLFLYLQYAYRHHLSPFSLVYLRKSLELFWYVALPVVVSSFLVVRHHRWALSAFAFTSLLIGFKVVEGLFIEFNKIIVVALFFFAVISYFLYQLLAYYYRLAVLNPNYSRDDLFSPLLTKIDCRLRVGETVFSGVLTNWDQEGCFLRLPERYKFSRKTQITIYFQGREFSQEGEVVSQTVDGTGIGLRFKETPKDLTVFNWSEFIELVHELGFMPGRLR